MLLVTTLISWSAIAAKKCPFELFTDTAVQKAQFERNEGLRAREKWLQELSLQPLTATQQLRRGISMKIDSYLYMNDVGPLVTEFDPMVRKVESSFVALQNNKALLTSLKNFEGELPDKEKPTPAKVDELLTLLSGKADISGLPVAEIRKARTGVKLKEILAELREEIEGQNQKHEETVGRHFDEYEQIRGHLDAIIYGDEAALVSLIDRIDSRVIRALPGGKSNAAGMTVALAPSAPKTRKEIVAEKTAKIDSHLEELDKFRTALLTRTATDLSELREYVRANQLSNESLLKLLEAKPDDTAARAQLLEELTLLSDRLLDSKTVLVDALKLQDKLGLHTPEFNEKYPNYLGTGGTRPSLPDVRKLAYGNARVEEARLNRSVEEQEKALINAWLLLGKVAETLGDTAQKISATSHNTFGNGNITSTVDWFFRDLADLQARKQYFPHLLMLRRTEGSAAKKLDVLRRLNALTPNDELLVTLARSGHLLETWLAMKEAARSTIVTENGTERNLDPLDFYGRMQKAEERAKGLPELSPLDESSYLQHLGVAGVKFGTAAASGWLLSKAGLATLELIGQLLGGGSPGGTQNDDDKKELGGLAEDLSLVQKGLLEVEAGKTPDSSASAAASRIRSRIEASNNK